VCKSRFKTSTKSFVAGKTRVGQYFLKCGVDTAATLYRLAQPTMPRICYYGTPTDSTVRPSVGTYLIYVGRSSCAKRLNQRQSMTPEGEARIATAVICRMASGRCWGCCGVWRIRPFKRSVVIHLPYCSVPITALPVVDILGDWTKESGLDGWLVWYGGVFLPLSETASRNPCVRACGQRSSSCSSTVIAARLPVSRRVVHAAPRRFVPAAVPRVSIFIVALSLAEPNARPAPSESSRHGQTAGSSHSSRILVLSPVYRALLPGRRHGLCVLWWAISEMERRAYFELALGSDSWQGRR